jgi:hypothetical protein
MMMTISFVEARMHIITMHQEIGALQNESYLLVVITKTIANLFGLFNRRKELLLGL